MVHNLIKQQRDSWIWRPIVITVLIVAILIKTIVIGVIVDGDKKEDISPVKHQKHNLTKMIDPYNVKTCGISDPDYNEHEFVNMARNGQFPWIVSFQIATSTSDTDKKKIVTEDLHFCCGTFISSKWILSAAHCFATDSINKYLKSNKLKVVCGSHRVSSRAEGNQNLTIKHIYYHKRFKMDVPVGFDIALVELDKPVKFEHKRIVDGSQKKPFINAACLPHKDHKQKFNESARIAGWGLSNPKDPSSMPSKLLTTDILLAKSNECANEYSKVLRSDKPIEQFKKFDDIICASYATTRDACQSDSGGPLMQYVDGKAVVVGIVSYGIGCAKEGVPGLYTRTSAYINWIKDITEHGDKASVDFTILEPTNGEKDEKSSTTTATTTTEKPTTTKKADTKHKQNTTTSAPSTSQPKRAGSSTTSTSTTKSSALGGKSATTTTVKSKPSSSSTSTTVPESNFEFAE